MTTWHVEAGGDTQVVTDSTRALAIDIDPRQQRIRLGLQITSGGPQELWQGAVFRRFFGVSSARWATAVDWLNSKEAQRSLDTIAQGYTAEMLWTGDWVAQWSEEAIDAAHAIYDAIAGLLNEAV